MSKPGRRKPFIKFDEENGVITGGTITNLRSLFSLNVVRTLDKLISDIFTAIAKNELQGVTFLTNLPYRQDNNTQILRGYFRVANVTEEISRAFLTESTFDIIVTKNRKMDVQIDGIEKYNIDLSIPFITSKQPNAMQLPKIKWREYEGPVYIISTLVQQETPWRVSDMRLLYNGPDMPLLEVGVLVALNRNYKYPMNLNVRHVGTSKRTYINEINTITTIYNKNNVEIYDQQINFRVKKQIVEDVNITGRTTATDRIDSRKRIQRSEDVMDIEPDSIIGSEDQ